MLRLFGLVELEDGFLPEDVEGWDDFGVDEADAPEARWRKIISYREVVESNDWVLQTQLN